MIHVSKGFADQLTKVGKRHWIQKREEKIWAKGLGEMDTYWLQVKAGRALSTASCETTSSIRSTHIVHGTGSSPDDSTAIQNMRVQLHSRLGGTPAKARTVREQLRDLQRNGF